MLFQQNIWWGGKIQRISQLIRIINMASNIEIVYPENLLNTFLMYRRETRGQTQAEVIRELNERLGRKYDNNSVYRWKKQLKTLPEVVQNEIIRPEMIRMLEWLFHSQSWNRGTIDFELLSKFISPAIKNTDI